MKPNQHRQQLGITSRAYIFSRGRITDQELDLNLLLKTADIEPRKARLDFPDDEFQKVLNFTFENLSSEYTGFPFKNLQTFVLSLYPHKKSVMEILFVEYSKINDQILGAVLVTTSRNLRHFKTIYYAANSWNHTLKGTCYEIKSAFSKAFAIAKPNVFMEIAYYMVDPRLRNNNHLRVGEHLLKHLTRFKNVLGLYLHEKVIFFGGMRRELAEKTRFKPLIKKLPQTHTFNYPGDNEKSVFIVSTL